MVKSFDYIIDHPDTMLRVGAAYVMGKHPDITFSDERDAFRFGIENRLPMFRFEKSRLERVTLVLGILKGLRWHDGTLIKDKECRSLLDVGSGRGTFLYNLLDMDYWSVTAIDTNQDWVNEHDALVKSNVLHKSVNEDVNNLKFKASEFSVTTALEILEHLEEPQRAINELMRVTRDYCIISVPSRPDNNPQHIQLFNENDLRMMFENAGAKEMKFRYTKKNIIGTISC